jgi:class 3 adenylate cyclase
MDAAETRSVLTLVPSPTCGLDEVVLDGSEPTFVGRSSRCKVRLPEKSPFVSRLHATIVYRGGVWSIVDESRSGTFINGSRLTHGESYTLSHGDALQVGDIGFAVHIGTQTYEDHGEYTLSEYHVDFDSVEVARVLRAALELPERLAKKSDEAEIHGIACSYLIEALNPVISHAYVAVASEAGAEVIASAQRSELVDVYTGTIKPIVSRRLLRRLVEAPESVLFLTRGDSEASYTLTLDPSAAKAVGAAMLEMDGTGQYTVLYVLGDVALEHVKLVAPYLRLTATLLKQHLSTQRRAHLSKYFSPQILRLLTQRGAAASLEGEPHLAYVTSLFFDVRGSSLPLNSSAAQLANVYHDLRTMLSIVTETIFENQGTVIDYAGDAVLAVWGIPFPQEDHADRAVGSALDIVRRLSSTRFRTFRAGIHTGGLGLASGEVLVGPVGSSSVFKYGVFGPSVNAAQRLSSLTKATALGRPILMAADVAEQLVRYRGQARHVATVELQGMRSVVDIFEPLLELRGAP